MASKDRDKDNLDATPQHSLRSRSKRVYESSCSDVENDHHTASMSLDMLAHVASETLRNEPKSKKKSTPKRTTMRNVGRSDTLSLEQIQGLTEKTILNLFTDVVSNEISRTYTMTCHLMPQQCQQTYSSFGSEMRARMEMKKHVYEHLEQLDKEAANSKTKFTAEPLPARRKRLMNAFMPPKKSPVVAKKKSLNIEVKKSKTKDNTLTIKSSTENSMDMITIPEMQKPKRGDTNITEDGGVKFIGFVPVADKMKVMSVSKGNLVHTKENPVVAASSDDSDDENERRIEENEQFIIDLLSKTQPHHDHSYTTIFGRRKGANIPVPDDEEAQTGEVTVIEKEIVIVGGSKSKVQPTPILFLRHRSPDETVPMVSVEEIIDNECPDKEAETQTTKYEDGISSGEKPYPPMPKSVLAKRGRLGFDIGDIQADGSDEECEFLKKKKRSHNPLGREGREGNLGWEPKLALRYIRELKGRKKDEIIPLKCKICDDKMFTAAATLMYHYRSHAGIKPFVCLICNTTFTRQHSLNYHMLIHNNQSRFTCKDCGRKFRHPSHFKEHLRRHTGETPFNCADCGQRFKTRNTYKRHLKTRHGKLLTASGIHQLTVEEFAKVRTKRYKIPFLPDISYKMPELTFTKIKERKQEKRGGLEYVSVGYDGKVTTSNTTSVVQVKQEPLDEDDDDPELDKILEVLQESVEEQNRRKREAHKRRLEVECKREEDLLKARLVEYEKTVLEKEIEKKQIKKAIQGKMKEEVPTEGEVFTTGIFVNKKYAENNAVNVL